MIRSVRREARYSEEFVSGDACPFCGGKILSDGFMTTCERDMFEFHIRVNLVFIGSLEGMEAQRAG